MRRFLQRLVLVAILWAGGAGAEAADLLIHGGPIHLGAGAPLAEALVTHDGKVAFAGSLVEARKAWPGAQDVDLQGAAAFPGFVDSHAHLMSIGFREMTLNLEGTSSAAELTTRLKAWVAAHPGTDMIVGRGWIETHWPEKRFPTRADLDAASPDRPMSLGRASTAPWSTCWASAA